MSSLALQNTSALQAIVSLLRQAIDSLLRQAIVSLLRQAIVSLLRQAIDSLLRQAIDSLLRQAIVFRTDKSLMRAIRVGTYLPPVWFTIRRIPTEVPYPTMFVVEGDKRQLSVIQFGRSSQV